MSRTALKPIDARAVHSIDAEQCVLGGLILDNNAFDRVSGIITAADLYRRGHSLIFNAIAAIVGRGDPTDIVTVSAQLEKSGEFDAAGGLAYLGELANNTPSAANITAYAVLVRDQARARRLQTAATAIANGDLNPEAITALERAVADLHRREETVSLAPVDLSTLSDCDIDPTRYAIEPVLPKGHVTLLGSHGGAGKSILALTLAAHVVCGRPWCGLPVTQGAALYVSLEDPGELVRYRLRRIANEYGLDHASLEAGLRVLDGSAADAVLAVEINENGTRRLLPTATMEELAHAAAGRSLIVIDNSSDAYDANENDRRMVRGFLRRLAHLARAQEAAVQLLAHIDKPAAKHGNLGNTYSGSTAWHNSARSRLALTEQGGRVELVHEKNNLGKKVEPITLTWSESGVLVPVAATASAARDSEDDTAVLSAIQTAIDSGATVHAARSGSHSTLAILKTYPDLPPVLRKDSARFWSALTRLERAGRVCQETYRNEYRKERVRLCVRAPLPHTPCALTRAQGRANEPVPQEAHRRTTGALAHGSHDEIEVPL